MHEVTESAPVAFAHIVLSTTRFPEVGDGREFCKEWATGIPPLIESIDSDLSLVLPVVSGIDVTDEMVADVIADMHFEEVAVFDQFAEDVLVERFKVGGQFCLRELAVGVVSRVLVHVGDDQCLREGGLDVLPRASFPVPTCADLEIERAVHLVLFRAVDVAEMGSHYYVFCF